MVITFKLHILSMHKSLNWTYMYTLRHLLHMHLISQIATIVLLLFCLNCLNFNLNFLLKYTFRLRSYIYVMKSKQFFTTVSKHLKLFKTIMAYQLLFWYLGKERFRSLSSAKSVRKSIFLRFPYRPSDDGARFERQNRK